MTTVGAAGGRHARPPQTDRDRPDRPDPAPAGTIRTSGVQLDCGRCGDLSADGPADPRRHTWTGTVVLDDWVAGTGRTPDGIVVDHTVEPGNPPDAPQLAPAIERISRRTGRPPKAVAADRGYGEAGVETDLH